MSNITKLIRTVALGLLVLSAGACGTADEYWAYDPYDDLYDPWYDTDYGYYTVVHRPVVVVDGWSRRTFDTRYRGWRVDRHNSPVIVYKATKGNDVIEVHLTPRGDNTHVEVKARQGKDKWNRAQAKTVLGQIIQESRATAQPDR